MILSPFSVDSESVIFEAFEASPMSQQVLTSKNALQWDFPGSAVAIPFSEFIDPAFQEHLAAFLEQASTESVKQFAASTIKAGSSVVESRDTVDPALITQMLMTLLQANGTRIFPPLLRKRVRDDVCWANAEMPWRRCPFWLLLRVAVQRHLCILAGATKSEVGRVYYKFLICLVLSRLLSDSLGYLSPEASDFLKRKLCRRLAKLETDKVRAPATIRAVYEHTFAAVSPIFKQSIRNVNDHIASAWAAFKHKIRRPIPTKPNGLPRYADRRDLLLSFPNCGPYLRNVLAQPIYINPNLHSSILPPTPTATQHLRAFADRYFSLTNLDVSTKSSARAANVSPDHYPKHCMKLAETICSYLNRVAGAYDQNPEQMSSVILNVMELWVSMDEFAIQIYNLLKEYVPIFRPEVLDVLQLPHLEDMCRLQKIQTYLHRRYSACGSNLTIFVDPMRGCFAERYFNESKDSLKLKELQECIESAAEAARTRKEEEWVRLSAEYENLMQQVAASACVYTTSDIYPFELVHDDRNCTKCYRIRCARRMQIQVHEHPLPSEDIPKKAVIFELGIPHALAAYRDATWRILYTLACPPRAGNNAFHLEPRMHLYDYSGLQNYVRQNHNVSLASTTKSFLNAHWSRVSFPVSLDKVCLSNGLDFMYYDSTTRIWPGQQARKPTFAHHCGVTIPANSPFSSIQCEPNFAVDANGPSSYEVISTHTKCPAGLNVHEYMAYQALFSGKTRRWPSMLMELGSSNLNFSAEATMLLFRHLSSQAGPYHPNDHLRLIHVVFRDNVFCKSLLEQVRQRLDGISSNWRETHCMELLLTLILRLWSLGSSSTIREAAKLLENARAVLLKWIRALRNEVYNATDVETVERSARYAFWAALLCRRTFAIWTDEDDELGPIAFSSFIESSIALQDNAAGNPAAFPSTLKHALIRDLKKVYQIQNLLLRSIKSSPNSLISAINNVWPEPEGAPQRSFSEWKVLPAPYDHWVQSTVQATQIMKQQTLWYHLLEGYLLIDGQPLGKLPPEHRKSKVLDELFGNQNLLMFPSGLPGMTYMLGLRMNGHQVHVGFRDNRLIVRACLRDTVLEHVEREVFGSPANFDLPGSLVENCVHWLDLKTGILEARQRPNIWKSKQSNWNLDIHNRFAYRRNVTLVDPHSLIFDKVAKIFEHFEYRHHLTVFQPERGSLTVEFKRLELNFSVNQKFHLESRQLRSEIDPNQDAGTWYGLNSKIVLRDAKNPLNRSILVPMGKLTCKRNGMHVSVFLENTGVYGRFAIDAVLGRLSCPSEPWLLYKKTELHAYTSFIIPDPLTGRTGTEEALHCLMSGYCQPWTPLQSNPYNVLMSIAKLTPKREYYPKDLRRQQSVQWDANLTETIQHEAFRLIVEDICRKSEQLSTFAFQKTELSPLDSAGDAHLRLRSYFRRSLYLRQNSDSNWHQTTPDLSYEARDHLLETQRNMRVYETITLIRKWPSSIPTSCDLASILQNWPRIGGYDRVFDKILISDRLTVDFAVEWGALIHFCNSTEMKNKYRLMFLFGVIAFGNGRDMDIVRTMIAFAVLRDLKSLDPPRHSSYSQFRQNQAPSVGTLMQLIKNYYKLSLEEQHDNLGFFPSSKQHRAIETARAKHEEECEKDAKAFAQYLLDQWPCAQPTVEGAPGSDRIDIAGAMIIIRPEWLRLFQNSELSEHIQQVQRVLSLHHTDAKTECPQVLFHEQLILPTRCRGGELPTLSQDLLCKMGPDVDSNLQLSTSRLDIQGVDGKYSNTLTNCNLPPLLQERINVKHTVFLPGEIQELEDIIHGITRSKSTVQKQYGDDLKQSLNALKMLKSAPHPPAKLVNEAMLSIEVATAEQAMRILFDQLCKAFEQDDVRAQWLRAGGLWPCITPVTLLEQLRSTLSLPFGSYMKESLVAYAVSITALQRLLRITDAYRKDNYQRLFEEQKNLGHSNWQPLEYPDWLLLEIDANIQIRSDQVDVALATILPASQSNSVLQMNMGQGKLLLPHRYRRSIANHSRR
jgi:Protein of unknown function (DUF3638)